MRFEDHCEECLEKLGKPFPKVHKWIDKMAKTNGWAHRHHRHHTEGVEQVRKMFGDEAAKAAEMHIRSDLMGELPSPEKWKDTDSLLNGIR